MTQDVREFHPEALGLASIDQILPARASLVGEFSPAYEAYRAATTADLAPKGHYEYILALQIVDLNWAILQRKASAEVELSGGVEEYLRRQLSQKLEREYEREYDARLQAFEASGGDEEDFEDPIAWGEIMREVAGLVEELKSQDGAARSAALARVLALGVRPEEALSSGYIHNKNFLRHGETIRDLERRARQLSAEYREVQRSRPIELKAVDEQ